MERFICLLEIVEYESFIKGNSADYVEMHYKRLQSQIVEAFEERKTVELKDMDYFSLELSFNGKYIILVADDHGPADFFHIISIAQEIIAVSLAEGFPLVGCIHCEEFSERPDSNEHGDGHLARLLRSKAFWTAIDCIQIAPALGCLITANAQLYFDERRTKNTYTVDDLVRLNLLAWMPVSGIDDKVLAVNWMADVKLNFDYGFLKSIFARHGKVVEEWGEQLISNTRAFIATIQAERLN